MAFYSILVFEHSGKHAAVRARAADGAVRYRDIIRACCAELLCRMHKKASVRVQRGIELYCDRLSAERGRRLLSARHARRFRPFWLGRGFVCVQRLFRRSDVLRRSAAAAAEDTRPGKEAPFQLFRKIIRRALEHGASRLYRRIARIRHNRDCFPIKFRRFRDMRHVHRPARTVEAIRVDLLRVFHGVYNALRRDTALRISIRRDRAFRDDIRFPAMLPDIPRGAHQHVRFRKGFEQEACDPVFEKTVYDLFTLRIAPLLLIIQNRPHARKNERIFSRRFPRAGAACVHHTQHRFHIRAQRERVRAERIRLDRVRTRRDIIPVRLHHAFRMLEVVFFTPSDAACIAFRKIGPHRAVEQDIIFTLKQVHHLLLFVLKPLYHIFTARI